MNRDALTIGQSDRRDIFAKFDNEVFDARFNEADVPCLPVVARSPSSSSPGVKRYRARMRPIKTGGVQLNGYFNVVEFVDSGVSPADIARIGVQSYAQPHFRDRGANINLGFSFLNA